MQEECPAGMIVWKACNVWLSCHYYGEGDHCMAAHIEIQPPNASNTHDTDCATFTPKY